MSLVRGIIGEEEAGHVGGLMSETVGEARGSLRLCEVGWLPTIAEEELCEGGQVAFLGYYSHPNSGEEPELIVGATDPAVDVSCGSIARAAIVLGMLRL